MLSESHRKGIISKEMSPESSGNGITTTSSSSETHLHDLPDAILSIIFSLVSDTRSRNSMSLVCRKWAVAERSSRTSLSVRADSRYLLHLLSSSFRSISSLDLSLLSPWGHSLPYPQHYVSHLHLLLSQFPQLSSLSLYSRHPSTLLQILPPLLRQLTSLKLVRYHQRPANLPVGDDLSPVFDDADNDNPNSDDHSSSSALTSLDLSQFYCWTEDVPAALSAHLASAVKLTHLNVLLPSTEGFRSDELRAIAGSCPNLVNLLAACLFDPRYVNSCIGDEALLAVAAGCPKLKLLHLIDASTLSSHRPEPPPAAAAANAEGSDDGYSAQDALISVAALEDVFTSLQALEDLALDIGHNVRDSGRAMEVLGMRCRHLRSLKLGHLHGICKAEGQKPDGLAMCGSGLEALYIKNSADLTDAGLVAVSGECPNLTKLEIHGCGNITEMGIKIALCRLRQTLVEVGISNCRQLDAPASFRAIEPIRDRVRHIHVDCIWGQQLSSTKPPTQNGISDSNHRSSCDNGGDKFDSLSDRDWKQKKPKYNYIDGGEHENGVDGSFWCKTWPCLQSLSLWIPVGAVLTPLIAAGLEYCPALEEIKIKVEGDCRCCMKPTERAFGLSSLVRYPNLSRMNLHCGDVTGFALSAPPGQMDLSLWERFLLTGVGELNLSELDYWPPQDRDMNRRSVHLPTAGLLASCLTLRKLFIHGTMNEHFMTMLLRIPNLRDVQLREDYYPAPENDMSTEMRVPSCTRFEEELNRRPIPD